jgi:hypothetical protein
MDKLCDAPQSSECAALNIHCLSAELIHHTLTLHYAHASHELISADVLVKSQW